MRASHCSPSRVRFLTLDLCYLKQQARLPTAWSELQIFHLAGQRESAATITASSSAHSILMHWFTLSSGLVLEWKCTRVPANSPLEGAAPHPSVELSPDGCRLHSQDWLPLLFSSILPFSLQRRLFSSELSNRKNKELNSLSLFKQSTFLEQSRGAF